MLTFFSHRAGRTSGRDTFSRLRRGRLYEVRLYLAGPLDETGSGEETDRPVILLDCTRKKKTVPMEKTGRCSPPVPAASSSSVLMRWNSATRPRRLFLGNRFPLGDKEVHTFRTFSLQFSPTRRISVGTKANWLYTASYMRKCLNGRPGKENKIKIQIEI